MGHETCSPSWLCDRNLNLHHTNAFIYVHVMRSMKRDHKSANVNFEIIKYIVDDYLTNIKKKVDQKV